MRSIEGVRHSGVGISDTIATPNAPANESSGATATKAKTNPTSAKSPLIHSNNLIRNRTAFSHPSLTSFLKKSTFLKKFKKKDTGKAPELAPAKGETGNQGVLENNSSPSKLGSKRLGEIYCRITKPKPVVADSTGIDHRMLDDAAVATLVNRYGDSFHVVLIDPRYKIFSVPNYDSAVGYKVQSSCAVVAGEPLCAPQNKKALTEAFEAMCAEKSLTPVYCAAGREFAHETGKRGGDYVEFGEEQVMNPTSENEKIGKKILRIVRQAKESGIKVDEFHPKETDSEGFNKFKTECQALIDRWVEAKDDKMHASGVNAFPEGAVMRWITTRDRDGRLTGLAVLAKLESKEGYYINYNIKSPDAPTGTSESLIHGVKTIMAGENVTYLTWGVTPAPKLGDMKGVSQTALKIANIVYGQTRGKLPDYDNFRNRYGAAERRDPLYIVFPRKYELRSAYAVMRAMGGMDEVEIDEEK